MHELLLIWATAACFTLPNALVVDALVQSCAQTRFASLSVTHTRTHGPKHSPTYSLINPRSFDVTVDGRLIDRNANAERHGVVKTFKYMLQWYV